MVPFPLFHRKHGKADVIFSRFPAFLGRWEHSWACPRMNVFPLSTRFLRVGRGVPVEPVRSSAIFRPRGPSGSAPPGRPHRVGINEPTTNLSLPDRESPDTLSEEFPGPNPLRDTQSRAHDSGEALPGREGESQPVFQNLWRHEG